MQTAIIQPSADLGPKSAPVAAPAAGIRTAFRFGRLPPTALLLLAIVAVQLGGALANMLFSSLGPIGITFASSGFAAAVLTLFGRPRPLLRGSATLLRRHSGLILGYGAVELALTLPYFLALQRIPLGILATITFLGPLGLAVLTSRRAIHFLWIGIAALGVALLTPEVGTDLDPLGLFYAAIAGLAWAAFVPLSQKTGAVFPGTEGLAWALWVCTAMMLPAALIEGTMFTAGLTGLTGAFAVALLGVVAPLALEFQALRGMSARTYGILVTLEPAAGAIVGVICLNQPAGPRMIVAVACVMLAALGVTLSDRRDSGPKE